MRISESPRVLQRTAAPVRTYPDVNDGEYFFDRRVIQKRGSAALYRYGLVGTTSYTAGAFEQTWIGRAAFKTCDGFFNRLYATPSATPRFVLEGALDRLTAALAKRE